MSRKNCKILVIDDEDISLTITKKFLSSEEYTILTSNNTTEAYQIINDDPEIDLILLDWIMPETDGLTFLRKLKERNKNFNIPVIMQTAVDDAEKIQDAIKNGIDCYMVKPYTKQHLISNINNML